MADIFSLVGKVSVDYAQAVTALDKVSDAAEDTADDIEKAGESTDNFGDRTQSSGNRAVSVFKRIGTAIMSAFSKRKEIDDTETSLKDLTSTIDKQESELSKLKTKYADLYVTQGKNSKEAKETAKEIDKLSSELKENKSVLQEAERAADKYDNSLDEVGDSSERAGGRMSSAFKKIGAVVAAAFAVDKTVDFGKAIVDASATVAAEQSAFEQIMGDYSNTAQQKINEIADTTGMVSTRLTPYMTSMTAKFKGLGYDIDDATTLAQDGLTLAADAAAFWDKSLEDSMGALNSFINGSYEGGEAIGLFANDTQLASYAVKQGIVSEAKEWANLDEARKQATRLQYAQDMMKASGATGQAAKEADQYANVQANLNEKWRQFKAQIGEPLLQNIVIPAMGIASAAVDKFSAGFDRLKNSSDVIKELGTMFSEMAQTVSKAIPQVVSKLGDLMSRFGKKIQEHLPDVISKGLDLVIGFTGKIRENLPVLIQSGMEMLKNIAQGLSDAIPSLIEKIPLIVSNIAGFINDNAPTILAAGVNIVVTIGKGLIEAIPTLVANIPQILQAIWDTFTAFNWMNLGRSLIDGIKNGVKHAGEGLKGAVKNIFKKIEDTVKNLSNSAKSIALNIWNALKKGVSNIASGLKNFIGNAWNAIKAVTSSVFNAVKSVASSVWNGIKSTISSVVEGVKSKVSSVWNSIKSTTSSVFNGIKSTASSVWNSIKSAIEKPINTARDAVKRAIDKMKSFFNFSWSLPKLKLPHISISGGFSIMPPKAPKFSIKWYKKAMDNAMLLNSPYLFGYDQKAGSFLGAGEAGTEVVSGANTLMGMIRDAVAAENKNISYRFEQLIKLLETYMPEIIRNTAKNIYLDTGVLVGELGTEMDYKLGNIAKMRERGM